MSIPVTILVDGGRTLTPAMLRERLARMAHLGTAMSPSQFCTDVMRFHGADGAGWQTLLAQGFALSATGHVVAADAQTFFDSNGWTTD